MSWWPLEGNPGDFPTTLRFCVKATSRPAVAHQIRQQGGLLLLLHCTRQWGRLEGDTGPSAGCCLICDQSDFPLHRISTLIYFMKA